MKQAVAGLGSLRYLATRAEGEVRARVVQDFQFGDIYPKLVETSWNRGTEIAIGGLKPIVRTHPISFSRDIVPYLGARYRRFLTTESPRARIVIRMVDIDEVDQETSPKELNNWSVTQVRPIYYHPNTHLNSPVVDHRTFSGDGWEADLVFGYSPEGHHEWEDLGLNEPTKFHPYAVSLSKQGLDILLNDRVIMFHQLPELGIVGTRHNQYNAIRGEIVLKSGFTTAITKNSIIANEHWDECKSKVAKYLSGERPREVEDLSGRVTGGSASGSARQMVEDKRLGKKGRRQDGVPGGRVGW